MKPVLGVLIVLLVLICYSSAQYSVCLEEDEDCGSCNNGDENLSTLFLLSQHLHYAEYAYENAIKYIKSVSPEEIIRMEDILDLHSTLNYFCCHTKDEKKQILKLLKEFKWYSFNVTMRGVGCNVDQHDNKTVYIWAYPDEASQKKMFTLVRNIESYLRSNGITINHARVQPFHNTLARVTHAYPTDEVVKHLENLVFPEIRLDFFFVILYTIPVCFLRILEN